MNRPSNTNAQDEENMAPAYLLDGSSVNLQYCCKEGDAQTRNIMYAPCKQDMPEIPDAKLVCALCYLHAQPSIRG